MLIAPRIDDFDWGRMKWLAEGAALKVSLARMTVKAGATSPAHIHDNCNEVVHVLAGAISQRRGAEWIDMAAGDALTIPAGVAHQTRNGGDEDAELMIAYSSGARHYEEVEH